MQITTNVVAGTDHVVDLFLDHVGFFSAEPDLVAPLVQFPIALDHGVVAVGRAIVKAVVDLVVLNLVGRNVGR